MLSCHPNQSSNPTVNHESESMAMIKIGHNVSADVVAAQLVELLLYQPWHEQVEFIADYMPPYPQKDTRPKFVIRYKPAEAFLRRSCGPKQGFFWDMYGDDFQTAELAVLALSQAPAPVDCRPITFTIPLNEPRQAAST